MSRSLYSRLAMRFDPDRVLLSRRDLMKSAAALAASGLLASVSRASQPAGTPALPASGKKKKVIVVGAGFGGLSCALELVARGHDVTILEGRGRVGGRVITVRDITENAAIEAGGEWIGANHPTWIALAKKFNLDLVETPEDESLYSPLMVKGELLSAKATESLYAEMSECFKTMNEAAKDLDPAAPWTAPNAQALDSQSVADWLRAQDCSSTCRAILDAQLTNDNSVPIAWQSYLGHLAMVKGGGLQDYWDNSETFRCRQGNQELATRMYSELGADRFLMANPAARVEWTPGKPGVVVIDARGAKHQGDYVVITVAPTVWKNIDFNPALPPGLGVQMGSASKMLFSVKKAAWKDLGLAPESLTDTDIGYTWESTGIQPAARNPVMCAFSGGPGAELGIRMGEAERNQQYTRSLNAIYKGIDEQIDSVRYIGWPVDRWTMAGYSFPAPGQATTTSKALAQGLGPVQFAGEFTSLAFAGYMEGALSSGVATARRIDAM